MNTCGTCKFKGEEITQCTDATNFQEVGTGYFQCMGIAFDSDQHEPIAPGNGAVTQDGSGYFGRLCVEADFGCMKWRAT